MFYKCPNCNGSRGRFDMMCEFCGSSDAPEFSNGQAILITGVLGGLLIYYLVTGEFPDIGGFLEDMGFTSE
ncbi:MAG: hypothetical protein Alpg2KO_04740 [Alphaproteobacteria bacterium]